jgi:hypothetical protein
MADVLIILAELLGVRIFKKYWPYGGSFWNNRHIDPTNKYDLETVINNAWDYTRNHVQALITELLVVMISYYSGYMNPKQCRGFIPVTLVIHGYALLVHYYNRTKAKARLRQIVRTEKRIPGIQLNGPSDIIQVIKLDNPERYFVHYNYTRLSPDFYTHGEAFEYRDYLQAKWHYDHHTVTEQIFLEQGPKVYVAWRAEKI